MNHLTTIITPMKDNAALRSSGEELRWRLLQNAGTRGFGGPNRHFNCGGGAVLVTF
jgi:hypothetical protein